MKMLIVFILIIGLLYVMEAKAFGCPYIVNETFDNNNNWSLSSGCFVENSTLICSDNSTSSPTHAIFKNQLINLSLDKSNWTITFQYKLIRTSSASEIVGLTGTNVTLSNPNPNDQTRTGLRTNGNNDGLDVVSPDGIIKQLYALPDTTWKSIKIKTLTNLSWNWTLDNNFIVMANFSTLTGNASFLKFGINGGSSIEFNVDNLTVTNDSTSCTSSNTSIMIDSPKSNNITHNLTINFKFNISDKNNNKINYSLFVDTNLNPIKLINSSNNTIELNASFIYTFLSEVTGSINGTYYWKVNGSNNLSIVFDSGTQTFNLTNNISNYNASNVTITTLPINVNDILTGHCNITTKSDEFNNVSSKSLLWYINKTLVNEAVNSTTLTGKNASLNANITFSCRINNGYGETAWTEYVNSSQQNVGDSVLPVIFNGSLSKTTYGASEKVNITAICQEINQIQYVRVTTNKTDIHTNNTMTLLSGDMYQFSNTFAVGDYNIPYFYCADASSNIGINTTSGLSFSVTSPSSQGSSGGGGGGGGGGGSSVTIQEIVILGNLSLILKPPLIQSNVIYLPFHHKTKRFTLELEANKVIDKCVSNVFECIINNNLIIVALNYSNDAVFFSSVSGNITLVDKANLAKTINANVKFYNLAYAIPIDLGIKSSNSWIFRLEGNKSIGIRVWFIVTLMIAAASGIYLIMENS